MLTPEMYGKVTGRQDIGDLLDEDGTKNGLQQRKQSSPPTSKSTAKGGASKSTGGGSKSTGKNSKSSGDTSKSSDSKSSKGGSSKSSKDGGNSKKTTPSKQNMAIGNVGNIKLPISESGRTLAINIVLKTKSGKRGKAGGKTKPVM